MLKSIMIILLSFLVSCVLVYFSKKNFKLDSITLINITLLTCLLYIVLSSNVNVSLTYENFVEHNENKGKDSGSKKSDNVNTKTKTNNKLDKKPAQSIKLENDKKPNINQNVMKSGLETKLDKEEKTRNYDDNKLDVTKHPSERKTVLKKKQSDHYKHTNVKKKIDGRPKDDNDEKQTQKNIGGCNGTRYGCCPDGKTASNRSRSNCSTKTHLLCNQSQYGCCPDGETDRKNKVGSNCKGYVPPVKPSSNRQSKSQPIKIVNNVTYKNDDHENVGARASSGDYQGSNQSSQRVPHYRRRSNVYDETPDYGPYYPGDDEDNGESDDYDSKYYKEGWSYMPPSSWSVPHKRDPVCLSSKKCPVCPVESTIKPYSEFLGSKEWKKDHSR